MVYFPGISGRRSVMFGRMRRFAAVAGAMAVLVAMGLDARPASAFPPGDPVAPFDYNIDAQTHIAKLNQDITVTGGHFTGAIDISTGELLGNITLPETTFTYQLAGIVPVITA